MSRSPDEPRGFSIKAKPREPQVPRSRYRVVFADRRRINDVRVSIAVWAGEDEDPRKLAETLLESAYGIKLHTLEWVETNPEIDFQ